MTEEPRKATKTQLAFALAQGISAAKWARSNEVPRNTAYMWAKEPMVRKAVDACRRRTLDLAIGRMNKHTTWAAAGIVTVAREAESDTVRLRAYRAIFSDMIVASKYTGLEGRMAEVEKRLLELHGAASGTVVSRTPANDGQGATPPAILPATSIATGAE
jgi:hypothetical protein